MDSSRLVSSNVSDTDAVAGVMDVEGGKGDGFASGRTHFLASSPVMRTCSPWTSSREESSIISLTRGTSGVRDLIRLNEAIMGIEIHPSVSIFSLAHPWIS